MSIPTAIYETNKDVINNAKSVAGEKGWELLRVRLFDQNPLNNYLKFVAVKIKDDHFATLLYNTDGGKDGKGFFAEGHYDYKTSKEALDDLLDRR
jgi:hypothetical protein